MWVHVKVRRLTCAICFGIRVWSEVSGCDRLQARRIVDWVQNLQMSHALISIWLARTDAGLASAAGMLRRTSSAAMRANWIPLDWSLPCTAKPECTKRQEPRELGLLHYSQGANWRMAHRRNVQVANAMRQLRHGNIITSVHAMAAYVHARTL